MNVTKKESISEKDCIWLYMGETIAQSSKFNYNIYIYAFYRVYYCNVYYILR